MGSYFGWNSVADVKAELRSNLRGRIVAEASGSGYGDGRESYWYLAVEIPESYMDLPAGSVIAETFIIYPPRNSNSGNAADGAGYKPVDEFMGPYHVNGVTKAFLAALTPLPPAEGDNGLAWAARWRADALKAAEKAEAAKALRKSLKPGDKVMLANVKPAGPFEIVELKKGGGARAYYNGYPFKISAAHLLRATRLEAATS